MDIKRIEDELRNIDVESLIMSDRSLEELLFKQKYSPYKPIFLEFIRVLLFYIEYQSFFRNKWRIYKYRNKYL